MMSRVLLVGAVLLAAVQVLLAQLQPAEAKSIVSEVQYRKSITVEFSPTASRCGLTDARPFVELAAKRLDELDVPNNPDAKTEVLILVSADATGLMKQRCHANIRLVLRAMMDASFLESQVVENQTNIFTVINSRNYIFPAVFYDDGMIYSDLAPEMEAKSLELLGLLFDHLAKERAKP